MLLQSAEGAVAFIYIANLAKRSVIKIIELEQCLLNTHDPLVNSAIPDFTSKAPFVRFNFACRGFSSNKIENKESC